MAEGQQPAAGFAARFVLSGIQSTKDWRAALHALNKIGAELMIEASEGQVSMQGISTEIRVLTKAHVQVAKLVLRAINAAKSAFLGVSMYNGFFEAYELAAAPPVQAAVLMKHVLATLRTQRISQYEWLISSDSSSLHVRVVADNGLVKTYRLNCTDSAVMHAGVDKAAYPTHVVAEAKELSRLLSTFTGGSQEEVTLLARPLSGESVSTGFRACQLQSYIDPQKDAGDGSVHTALGVDTKVFLSYSHNSNQAADATFNVKDFRAMLGFCEHLRANIRISMDQAGTPLVAEPDRQSMSFQAPISAELVLATLLESQLDAAVALPGHNLPAQQPAATMHQAPQQQYMQQAQFAQQQQHHPDQQYAQQQQHVQPQGNMQHYEQGQHPQRLPQQVMQQDVGMADALLPDQQHPAAADWQHGGTAAGTEQAMASQQQLQQHTGTTLAHPSGQQQQQQPVHPHTDTTLPHQVGQQQEHHTIGGRQGLEKRPGPSSHEDAAAHMRDQQQAPAAPAPPHTDGQQQHGGDAEMEDPEQLPGSLIHPSAPSARHHSHTHTTAGGEPRTDRIVSVSATTQRGQSGGSRQQLPGFDGDQLLDDDTDYVPMGRSSGAGVPRGVSAPGLAAVDTEQATAKLSAAVNMPRTLLSGASALLQPGQSPHPGAQRTLLSGASMWARAGGAGPLLNPGAAGPASGMAHTLIPTGGTVGQGTATKTATAAAAMPPGISGSVVGMQPGANGAGLGDTLAIAAASGYQRMAALRQSGHSPLAQQADPTWDQHGHVVAAKTASAQPNAATSVHGCAGPPSTNTGTLPVQDLEELRVAATEITSVGGSSNPRSSAGIGSHTQIAGAGAGMVAERQQVLTHHEAQHGVALGPLTGQAGAGMRLMPDVSMLQGMEVLPGTPDEEEPGEGDEEGQRLVSGRSQLASGRMAVQGSYHGMYFGTDMEM